MSSSRLRIVGINDVYALDELPRVASLITKEREVDPAEGMLITVAGDFLAANLLSGIDGGRGMVDCLNALGVTHVTLGNHEDDLPTENLLARLEELTAKVLLTNVPRFRGRHQSTDVVEVAGHRVGVLGVVNGDPALYRRPPFGGATVGPPNETVVIEARRLREQGCEAVIALTHQWLRDDRELADLGAVDLVLGGHEHDGTLELDHIAPLAKAEMNAKSAIVADLVFETEASGDTQVTCKVRLEPLAPYPLEVAMQVRVDHHLERVRALDQRVLLTLAEPVSSIGSRHGQTSFGTLVCSRLRDSLEADAALFNGGAIRGEAEHHDQLTFAGLAAELPLEGEVVVVVMPGAVVAAAIRFSHTHRVGTGGFLQVDDRLDAALLDPVRCYRVAIPRLLMLGVDEIEPLVEFAQTHPRAVPPATAGVGVKAALLATFTSPSVPARKPLLP